MKYFRFIWSVLTRHGRRSSLRQARQTKQVTVAAMNDAATKGETATAETEIRAILERNQIKTVFKFN